MLSNLEIARKTKPYPITRVAKSIGIKETELELYGNYKAKIDLSVLKRIKNKPRDKCRLDFLTSKPVISL